MKTIEIIVRPSSKKSEVLSLGDNRYKVCVKERPVENRANIAVCEILAEYFNVPRSHVQIMRGGHSKKKFIEIL